MADKKKRIYKLIEQIRIQAGYWIQFLKNHLHSYH